MDVRTVVEPREHTQQSQTADGAPADKFDEAVGGVGLGRDEHRATSVLAVVEGEKKTAPVVPDGFVVAAQRKSTALQLNHADKYAEQITQVAERLEHAIGNRADISREADTENVERINLPTGVRKANEIDRTFAPSEKGFNRGRGAVFAEVTEKRVAGAERKKTERYPFGIRVVGENAVQD